MKMSRISSGLPFLVWLIVASSTEENATRSRVLELTEENYDQVLKDTPLILVEFYATWCEYCQVLEPKYEAAAEELFGLNPSIVLARVDGEKEKNLYNRMGLNGYPSIFVYHNGRPFEYEGKRRTDAIVEFMLEEAKPDWKPPEDHVVVLSADNFTEHVTSSELTLVEFYAPWCGHCKRLAPEYARAAKELNLKHNISLANVDATEEVSLAKEFGVDGYPTLFLFRYGKKYDYSGPRTAKEIIEYMVNQSKPATQEFSSRKELDLFLASRLVPVIIAILPEGEEGAFWDAYLELANTARKTPLLFRHSSQLGMAKGLGLPETGGIVIGKPPRFQSQNEAAFTLFELTEGIPEAMKNLENEARPLVGFRTSDTEDWWSFPMVVAYLAVDTSLEGRNDFIYWRKRLLPVAEAFKGKIQVVMSDEVEYVEELQELALKDQGEDVVVALWASKKEKYAMREDFDEDSLNDFVELYFDGRLRPVLKSQRKPQQKGPVKIVVGSTFEEIVYDQEKDVLIEFYAPWCGHCKNLEPKYKELAKKFKKHKNLVIAKFDATANDAPPEFEFKGFPTIFFVPAGELNHVMKYEGGREVSDFASFLEENAIRSLGSRSTTTTRKETDEL